MIPRRHRSLLRPGLRHLVLLAALATATLPSPALAASVVVVVDTSRSLRPQELAAATRLATEAVEALPPETRGGVMAFDDEPRWVLRPGVPVGELGPALEGLEPAGRFTLLNDALFLAARELDEGGVILAVTDGRDENSATTVEDVATLARSQGVSIVTLGIGRRVASRDLRRLALLTDGVFLGTVGEVGSGEAARALAVELAEVRDRPAPPPSERTAEGSEARAVAEEADPGVSEMPETGGAADPATVVGTTGLSPLWIALAAVAALVGVVVAAVALRRRRPGEAFCATCGTELPEPGAECPHCAGIAIQTRLRDRPVANLEDTAEVDLLAEPAEAAPGDVLEKTRVLVDQNVLVVKEPAKAPRSFLLRAHAAFAVGRDPDENTLAIADASLSSRHFKIVPEEERYYVVDLDSTNGTYLNRERVTAAALRSGDVIHAGQAEFEFRSYPQPLG